jgi:hypothetical protein
MGWGRDPNNDSEELREEESEMSLITLMICLIGNIGVVDCLQKYSCSQETSARITVWGHNHRLLDYSEEPVNLVRGLVLVHYDQPVDDALVEVFDLDDASHSLEKSDDLPTKVRRAACITNNVGGFSFSLPPGSYELVVSKPDWNSTSVLIVVDPQMGKQRDIHIPLNIGY